MHNSISVIVNVYAHPKFVDDAIISALTQRGDRSLEVILLSAIEGYAPSPQAKSIAKNRGIDLRIVPVPRGPVGQGLVQGYEAATGDLISLLDEDDLWEAGKLESVERSFGNADVVFHHHGQLMVDENNVPLPVSNFHRWIRHPSSLVREGHERIVNSKDVDGLARVRALEPEFNNSSITVRRQVIGDNLSALRRVSRGEDTFLFYCAMATGRSLALTTDRLTRYRLHPGSVTAAISSEPGQNGLLTGYVRDVDQRLEQLRGIGRDVLEPGDLVTESLLRSDVAFWETLKAASVGQSRWSDLRQRARSLLGESEFRPRPKELLTTLLGISSVASPNATRRTLELWRRLR